MTVPAEIVPIAATTSEDTVRSALERRLASIGECIAMLVVDHWNAFATTTCLIILGGAVGVAYLRSIDATWLAEPISLLYRLLCPQRPTHSYFPFGAQMALEQRMVAMFGAQALGGMLFGLLRRHVRPLPGRLLFLLTIPILIDGFSQTFGLRDSDWFTRSWTGGLFNLAFVFWAYPRLDAGFRTAGIVQGSTRVSTSPRLETPTLQGGGEPARRVLD